MCLHDFDVEKKNATMEKENREEMGHQVSWDSLSISYADQMLASLPITPLPRHLSPSASARHSGPPNATRLRRPDALLAEN